jgi:hypothetical protein
MKCRDEAIQSVLPQPLRELAHHCLVLRAVAEEDVVLKIPVRRHRRVFHDRSLAFRRARDYQSRAAGGNSELIECLGIGRGFESLKVKVSPVILQKHLPARVGGG